MVEVSEIGRKRYISELKRVADKNSRF